MLPSLSLAILAARSIFRPFMSLAAIPVESTRSLPTSEIKQPRAWLVLWWGTAWEDQGAANSTALPTVKLHGSNHYLAPFATTYVTVAILAQGAVRDDATSQSSLVPPFQKACPRL